MLPSARRDPKALRPLETIYEDKVGDDIPTTHVVFLPLNPDLGSAPFCGTESVGSVDEIGEEQGGASEAASSTLPAPMGKPKLEDWSRQRSVSRVKIWKAHRPRGTSFRPESRLRPAALSRTWQATRTQAGQEGKSPEDF